MQEAEALLEEVLEKWQDNMDRPGGCANKLDIFVQFSVVKIYKAAQENKKKGLGKRSNKMVELLKSLSVPIL